MNELMSFIKNTNETSLEDQNAYSFQTQNLENQFAISDTTTINPLYQKPTNYKIEQDGYGTVAETPDKRGTTTNVNYNGQVITLVDDKDATVVIGGGRYGPKTKKEKNSTELYQINLDFISNLDLGRANVDLNISSLIFQSLGRNPVVNGKTYTVSDLSKIYNDPKQRDLQNKITEQANKLRTDPQLNPEHLWELSMYDLNAVAIEGQIMAAANKFNKSFFETTMYSDARRHAEYYDKNGKPNSDYRLAVEQGVIMESHAFLFKKDNTLKTFEEFSIDYINKHLPNYNATAKKLENSILSSNVSQFIINEKGERVANNMYKMKEQQEAAYWDQYKYDRNLAGDRPVAIKSGFSSLGVPVYTPTIYGKDAQGNVITLNPYTTKIRELDPKLNPEVADQIRMAAEYRAKVDPFGLPGDKSTSETKTSSVGLPMKLAILPTATTKNWQYILREVGRGYSALGEPIGVNTFNYKNLQNNYNEYIERLTKEYNLNGTPTAFKLTAVMQTVDKNKFENNRGGEIKGTKQSFTLDLENPIAYQEYRDEPDRVTGVIKPVLYNVLTPEARHFNEIYKLVKNDAGTNRYSIGAIGEIPEGNDLRDPILQLLQEAYTGSATRDKRTGKIKGIPPRGTVSYQGVVAGQTEYHAFHFDFNQDYLNQKKFKGTENEPGLIKQYPQILTDGITIYIPREISETKTTFGIQNYNSRTITPYEGTLSLDGKIDINIPNSGSLSIVQNDKDRTYDITGYNVDLNPSTMRMDTTRFAPIKVPYAGGDMDVQEQITNIINNQFYQKFMENNLLYKDILQSKGEKDPSKLILRVPYAQPQ
jgi:hypothetical protein